MKGTSKLLTLICIMLLLPALVFSLRFPMPVNGILRGTNVAYQEVKITNLRTGITEVTRTNMGGEYSVEWANTDDKGGTILRYTNGDQFRIEVTGCSGLSNDCIKTLTYTGGPELFEEWDLTHLTLACTPCSPCSCTPCSCGGGGGGGVIYRATKELCEKDFPCEACQECSPSDSCPEDNTPYASCDSCCPDVEPCDSVTHPPPECPECPGNLGTIIAWLLTLIVTMGGGIQIYRNYKGEAVFKHRHKGILGYHSVYTQHRNPKYRHTPYPKDPAKNPKELAKFVADVSRIENLGGMI